MLLKLALKNIRRNRRRTLITISAISFAVLFAVLMRSLRQGMEEQMLDSIVRNNMGYIQVHNKGFWDDQTLDNGFYGEDVPIEKIENLESVKKVDKKLEAGTLSSTGTLSRGTFIMSYDQTEKIPESITTNITSGAFPTVGNNEILLGEELAEYLEVSVGDTVVLLGMGYHGATAAGLYTLSGLIDMHIPELNRVVAYMSMKDLQYYLSAPDLLTALVIDVHDPDNLEPVKAEIQSIVGDNFEVMTWNEMSPELEQLIATSDAEGWIMNFILYMIITFVMFGTVIMATQERKYELGILQAIGMKKWRSMLMIVIENVIINMIGAFIGILITAPIAYYFHYNPIKLGGEQADLMEQYGFEAVIPFSIDPTIAMNHAGIVLIISFVVLIYPIAAIKKLEPVDAMKL